MKENKVSLLFYAILTYLMIFTVIILLFDKVTVFYFVNAHYNTFFDQLFYYITALGNGWTYALLLLAMLWVSYRFVFMFFSALLIKTIIVQSMKHLIFPHILRPHLFIENFSGLHTVNGVEILNYYSFPSGHSASIFCIAVLLSLIIRKNTWTVLFVILAILTGYSRMYLGQHFSVDVYAGSLIGILTAYFSWRVFVEKPMNWLNRISWIDKKISFTKAG
jgi:membrane-associated phospholipid phosphatase